MIFTGAANFLDFEALKLVAAGQVAGLEGEGIALVCLLRMGNMNIHSLKYLL